MGNNMLMFRVELTAKQMSKEIIGNSPEATPDQAQEVLDQVGRITSNLPVKPVMSWKPEGPKNKVGNDGTVVFVRYPDGWTDQNDPEAIQLAVIRWREADEKVEYKVKLTLDGMRLARHVQPPISDEEIQNDPINKLTADDAVAEGYNPDDLALAQSLPPGDKRDVEARRLEMQTGTDIAYYDEARVLITMLEQMEPLPPQPK
jgi:hypothetical protein